MIHFEGAFSPRPIFPQNRTKQKTRLESAMDPVINEPYSSTQMLAERVCPCSSTTVIVCCPGWGETDTL